MSTFQPALVQKAIDHLKSWVSRPADGAERDVPGVNAVVVHDGKEVVRFSAGVASWQDGNSGFVDRSSAPTDLYYLASITKPVTATAAMLLIQDGRLLLDDPIGQYLPEFATGDPGKERVLVRHLCTHTCGLPDMVPDNEGLRQRHAGLDAFAASACRADLLFPAGTEVRYSSAGLLLLAQIVERITRRRLHDVLLERLFGPLGLRDFTYHLPDAEFGRVARIRLQSGVEPTDWDNNSPYWRRLGAPWGGITASADSTARLGTFFLQAGWIGGHGRDLAILSPEVVRLMTRLHTGNVEGERLYGAQWGLGWSLGARWMGELATLATFGHIGSSGTMLWIDPPRRLVCCVLTNKITDWSTEWRRFARFSTALMAAFPSNGEASA